VNQKWTKETISNVTNTRVQEAGKGFITNFWEKNHWYSCRVQTRNQKELRITIQEEASEFQESVMQYVQENQIQKENIYVMDETGLWTGSVALRTYVNPQTHDVGVEQKGDHRRDTGIVTLSATGKVDSVFLPHQPQRTRKVGGQTVVVSKGISGVGIKQMKEWAVGFCERHQQRPAVVIMDALAAHKNKDVQSILESQQIKSFVMPPQTAKLISPCDNSFFHSLKSRLAVMDTSTRDIKERAFMQICHDYPEVMIINYFRHCGWIFD
jgi:hypothetical protein